MRIGLYGGSFDPVHCGHLLLAQAAVEELALDRIFFIPASASPFKPDRRLLEGTWRARLLRLALAGWNAAEVDTCEIEQGGISYTIDTIDTYRRQFPGTELFYMIGADHIASLPKWRDAARLGKEVTFVAMARPGEPDVPFPEGFRKTFLRGTPVQISSSNIRERLRQGRSVRHLVPVAVEEALLNNRLYL